MILLTCSAGGHLAEMKQLHPFYAQHSRVFVTFKRTDTEALATNEKVYFITRPARNPLNTIRAFFEAWGVLKKEKPQMVISTGADVTVPVCVAAWVQGIPIIFIESFCRPYTPSWSGRISSLVAQRVIYQWVGLQKYYPSGIYGGSIFATD